MVKCTGRGLVVKRRGVLSKVQMLNLVLGVGVFSLLPIPLVSRSRKPFRHASILKRALRHARVRFKNARFRPSKFKTVTAED